MRHSPDLDALGLGDGSIASDLAVGKLANWCTGNPCFTCKIKARRRELFPVLSRMQNSGYDLGENNRSPEWYRSNHRTPRVAGRIGANAFACPAPTGM